MTTQVTLQGFLDHQDFYIAEAKAGKIFVYPTDTIYGIGAIYTETNKDKIFQIKNRDQKKMFSIIAPSFARIEKNYNIPQTSTELRPEKSEFPINEFPTCLPVGKVPSTPITINNLKKYLENYHGVTYIFSYKTPGVRIIKHPFQNFVETLGEPFITTSCNIAGEPVVTEVKNIPADIAQEVDYIIDGGVLGGRPSVLIDLVANKIIER